MSIETTTTKDGRIYKPAVLSWKPRVRRFRLHVKAARHKHTVPAVHSTHSRYLPGGMDVSSGSPSFILSPAVPREKPGPT